MELDKLIKYMSESQQQQQLVQQLGAQQQQLVQELGPNTRSNSASSNS